MLLCQINNAVINASIILLTTQYVSLSLIAGFSDPALKVPLDQQADQECHCAPGPSLIIVSPYIIVKLFICIFFYFLLYFFLILYRLSSLLKVLDLKNEGKQRMFIIAIILILPFAPYSCMVAQASVAQASVAQASVAQAGSLWKAQAGSLCRQPANNQTTISAGVVPHHPLAKEIIEDFFLYISSKENPKTVVLLSPDHFKAGSIVGRSFISVKPDTKRFHGIMVNDEILQRLASLNKIAFKNSYLSFDHGITTLLPYIKQYLKDSKIVPILIPSTITKEELNQITYDLDSYSDIETIVVASVDFSHYLPPEVADFHDLKSIADLINFKEDHFERLEVDSWQALYIARLFAKLRGRESPKIIAHKRSSDFLKFSKLKETTSYFSVVFEKGPPQRVEQKSILFVGDIMLDRKVRQLMAKYGPLYPFRKARQFLRGVDIFFGNLEGPIVDNPKISPYHLLRFSFEPEVAKILSAANFNLLSLANNHTLDEGYSGLKKTRDLLKAINIQPLGDPLVCNDKFSYQYEDVKFFAFNTIGYCCSLDDIIKTIKEAQKLDKNLFIIVSIHWGNEYSENSSSYQKDLAHKMIDAGADLIVGHHPHVVQDIEIYRNKLIFYSLGNFIFDQYLSEETQEGIALGLELYQDKLIYRLFPLKSHLSQPCLMEREEAQRFLERLALRSSKKLHNKIKDGIINAVVSGLPNLTN